MTRGTPLASIHRVSEKAHSRKPIFVRPHTYTVPGSRQAGLFSELPRRTLLGNSEGWKGLWHQKSGLNQKPYTLLSTAKKAPKYVRLRFAKVLSNASMRMFE